jgi:hypothetical protein
MGKIFSLVGISILFSLFFNNSFVLASNSLSLAPSSATIGLNQTAKIAINLDTGGVAVNGADIVLIFDPSVLSVSAVTWGNLFGENQPKPTIDNTIGKIILHPSTLNTASTITGQGVLAILTVKGISSGSSKLNFVCTNGATQNETNIWAKGNDILLCSSIVSGLYTVRSGFGSVLSANDTTPVYLAQTSATTTVTPSPTITENYKTLPEAGSMEDTFIILLSGLAFIGLGGKLLFSQRQ